MITEKDKQRLRDLAKHQSELANSERNRQLYKDWEIHGKTDNTGRPMITIELGTFSGDFIPQLMQCESEQARNLEWHLLSSVFPFENFGDDTIVSDYIGCIEEYGIQPFGINVERENTDGLGYHFISKIHDLAEDFHKLGKSPMYKYFNKERYDFANETVGDILPVKMIGNPRSVGLLQNIVCIMDMEDMYAAMLDEPELFHKMCDMLTNDHIEAIDRTEAEGLLRATNGEIHLGQGTMCFTDDLPKEGTGLKSSDIWIYMDAQEAEGISAATYHEFFYPYMKRISDKFGLLSYGCCEGVDRFWNDLATLPNLRKLSISAWTDEDVIGEALQGRKTVYHRKPAPQFIGVDRILNEDAVRASIKKTVQCAKGLTLEFSQRDVYTVHNDVKKVARFVEIIREECLNKK